MRLKRQIDGLDAALVEHVLGRLLTLEPEATAVLLTGSYAKGTATATSDLDLMAITPSPRVGYRTWFEEQIGTAPLHVSAGATRCRERLTTGSQPARWSLGFPAMNAAVYLCTDEPTRARLGADPSLLHPAADPELEDFLEFALKAKRAAEADDELGLRWFAHTAAALAPGLLIPINVERVVGDRRDALDAALGLAAAPAHFAEDLAVCLGLVPASGCGVKSALARLGAELLAFLREFAPGVDDQPEIGRYLADGTLERRLGLID